MKNSIKYILRFSWTIVLLTFSQILYSQFRIDAGPDTTICYGESYEGLIGYQLGGNPTAQGGVEPYTFRWSGVRDPFPNSNTIGPFYASDDLNDTTIANPVIISDTYLDEWYKLYLEVTDSNNVTLTDSVKIRTSHFEYPLTANNPVSFTIEFGDSVQLPGPSWVPIQSSLSIGGYFLSPETGLIDPSDLSGYARPTKNTTYFATAVDIAGCRSKPVSYFTIEIDEYSLLEPNYKTVFGDTSTTWIMAIEENDEYTFHQFTASKYWPFFNYAYRRITSSDTNDNFEYYIREDKNSGKVWDYTYMYPIMDLALELNDTLFWESPVQDSPYAIVDSVYFWEDKRVIQFDFKMNFANREIPLKFIEGVGPNIGFLYQLYEDNQILLCVKKDGKLVYFNEEFSNENCELVITNILDEGIDPTLNIYPNPTSSIFSINNEFRQNFVLNIYNIAGELVKIFTSTDLDGNFDITGLDQGIYIVRLYDGQYEISIGKLLKL